MNSPDRIVFSEDIYNFINDCGQIHVYSEFCEQILKEIDKLIPYDRGHLYYFNDNSGVYDEFLVDVDKRWTEAYHEYYSKIVKGRYSIFGRCTRNGRYFIPSIEQSVYDYTQHDDEYTKDYLRPQRINYSMGFGLHDEHGLVKASFSLSRSGTRIFSQEEIEILKELRKYLDNLHAKFFVEVPKNGNVNNLRKIEVPLTPRETEIAELLMMGVSTQGISNKLFISPKTVYRHIASIHEKMHVSSRQELLVKLLSKA